MTIVGTIMHRDEEVARAGFDEDLGLIVGDVEVLDADLLPMGTRGEDGRLDRPGLKRWWERRCVPPTRDGAKDLRDRFDVPLCSFPFRSMGLSLSDQYWVLTDGSDAEWSDVDFFGNGFSDDVGDLLFSGLLRDDVDFRSPDCTTTGNLRKRWRIVDGERRLIKAAAGPYRQEPVNEVVATVLMKSQGIECTHYELVTEEGRLCSSCPDFIDQGTELCTAAQVVMTAARPDGMSLYNHYVGCCRSHGLDIVPDMDRMIVTDFLMANRDRHLNNFGIIRDAETLEWIKAAPVYDTGSSFLGDVMTECLEPDMMPVCKPFCRTFDKELRLVSDTGWIDFDALDDSLDTIERVLSAEGTRITQRRRDALMDALNHRIGMLRTFAGSR